MTPGKPSLPASVEAGSGGAVAVPADLDRLGGHWPDGCRRFRTHRRVQAKRPFRLESRPRIESDAWQACAWAHGAEALVSKRRCFQEQDYAERKPNRR